MVVCRPSVLIFKSGQRMAYKYPRALKVFAYLASTYSVKEMWELLVEDGKNRT